MKNSYLLLAVLFSLNIISCKDDEPAPTTPYIGCCNIPAVEKTIDNAKVYIPNAFTPNGDGINDLFEVETTNVDFILNFEIKDSRGNIIFQQQNFSAFFENPHWDGMIDHFGNDVIVGGVYHYEIEFFTVYGVQDKAKGSVCCYICDDALSANEADCIFSTQFDGSGFDSNLDNLEGDCLQ